MITQPFRNLVLDGMLREVAPATLMGDANAAQLTVVATVVNAATEVFIQQSNDAENWTETPFVDRLIVDSPGFYVMTVQTGICTQFIRVACEQLDDGSVVLGVTQHTMKI